MFVRPNSIDVQLQKFETLRFLLDVFHWFTRIASPSGPDFLLYAFLMKPVVASFALKAAVERVSSAVSTFPWAMLIAISADPFSFFCTDLHAFLMKPSLAYHTADTAFVLGIPCAGSAGPFRARVGFNSSHLKLFLDQRGWFGLIHVQKHELAGRDGID